MSVINQNHIDDLEDNKAKLNLPDFVYKCYGDGFTKRKIVGYRKRSTRYDLVFEDLENGKLYLEESDYIKVMIKNGFYTKQEIYKISQENQNYFYNGSCCDTDNGMRVYQIVEQDDLTYPEETYFHNPENAISEKEFLSKVPNPKTNYDWWGWNKSIDIIFGYNFNLDRHDFYER